MARLVTFYFEDNDMAERAMQEGLTGGKVNGLFAVPTKFCDCPHNSPAQIRLIARGAKLGWWVHKGCGKPLHNSWQSPRNLLDPDMRERDPYIKCTWTFKYNPGVAP